MPAPNRPPREGISLLTIVIASAASACAAFVVSRAWGVGTLIGAAVTPVIVAVVTEILRRPAARLPDLAPPGPRPVTGPPSDRGREIRIVAVTATIAFVIGIGIYVLVDRAAGGDGELVPRDQHAAPTETQTVTRSQTTTVVTQQQTVTERTVTVAPPQTVTAAPPQTVTAPAPAAATIQTQTQTETQPTETTPPPSG
ncbi:MAG: hypothetical protein JHC95_15635 [Solirubrobacteraceae bacterium]|nr:hypothetical protein [Solirubrobacteraceae bacterium]